MPKPAAKSFKATLERDNTPLKWTIVRLPFDSAKLWGKRGQFRVKGEINGFAFRTSLFPDGKGGHIMIANKQMQKGAKVILGGVAQFRLEPDPEERPVILPPELKRFFAEDRALARWYKQLNQSTRHDIGRWITQAKSAATRQRRAEQLAERLLATMEAEHELPPILKVAFAQDTRARAGWNLMSQALRRGHLLGIFYYRTPEGRARRLAKAIDEAIELAEKKKEKIGKAERKRLPA